MSLLAIVSLVFVGTLVQVPLARVLDSSAEAVTVRDMNIRYQGVVNGDYVTVGNGVLRCSPDRPGLNSQVGGGFDCSGLHGGSSATLYNDAHYMAQTGVTANRINASQAQVTIPAGAQVVRAELRWSGNTGVVNGTPGVRCGTLNVGGNGYVAPGGAPSTTQPQLTVGSAATVNVPVGDYAFESLTQLGANQPQYYSARQTVTDAFANVPTGSPVTITVGNIWTPAGYGCYGGWSLAMVYDFGSYNPANPTATAARNVILYDGHVRKFSTDTGPDTVTFSGFRAQGPGARAGFTIYEGDRSIVGDNARYTSTTNTSPIELTNAFNATNNIGVSQANGSVPFFTNNASPWINASVDVLSRDRCHGGRHAGDPVPRHQW